jgi:hypothetical protein
MGISSVFDSYCRSSIAFSDRVLAVAAYPFDEGNLEQADGRSLNWQSLP